MAMQEMVCMKPVAKILTKGNFQRISVRPKSETYTFFIQGNSSKKPQKMFLRDL